MLTESALKAHVKKYLDDPGRKDDLKEFEDKLVLSADNLVYTPKGMRYEITWYTPVREGKTLTDLEAKLFPEALKEQLATAVSQGGLLTTDAGIDYVVRLGPRPAEKLPEPKKVEPKTEEPKTEEPKEDPTRFTDKVEDAPGPEILPQ